MATFITDSQSFCLLTSLGELLEILSMDLNASEDSAYFDTLVECFGETLLFGPFSNFVKPFFFFYIFLANKRFIFHNFLLCCPSQRSARGQVPSQVATHQGMDNQLWAG
jgi:hypothetical protein